MSFGTREFWEAWYENRASEGNGGAVAAKTEKTGGGGVPPEPAEWFLRPADLTPVILQQVPRAGPEDEEPRNLSALSVGCGDSLLSFALAETGQFVSVLGLDYSQIVIEGMRRAAEAWKAEQPGGARECDVAFEHADVTDMGPVVRDSSIDVVIDKGTMDSMLCMTESAAESVAGMLAEVHRVLKRPQGRLIVISDGGLDGRRAYFSQQQWKILSVIESSGSEDNEFGPNEAYAVYVVAPS
jgi:Methyltransferase domain